MNMQEAALLKAHLDRAAGLEADVAALKKRVDWLEQALTLADIPQRFELPVKRKPGRPKKNGEAHA